MKSSVALRRATIDQLELVLPFVAAYHQFEHIESTAAQRKSAVEMLLGRSELGGIWLIICDGVPAGYIALCRGFSIEFNGFDAFVDEFFLSERYRGKGIGGCALEEIKAEARKLDISALHLEVARDNAPARRLYAKTGFESREKYVLMSVNL